MKITQKEVAKALNINNGDLSSMLNGNLGLSHVNAKKFADATGWTVGAVYDTDLAGIVAYIKFKLSTVGK